MMANAVILTHLERQYIEKVTFPICLDAEKLELCSACILGQKSKTNTQNCNFYAWPSTLKSHDHKLAFSGSSETELMTLRKYCWSRITNKHSGVFRIS